MTIATINQVFFIREVFFPKDWFCFVIYFHLELFKLGQIYRNSSYLLDLPDPAVNSRLQLVQESRIFHLVAKVSDFGLLPTLIALLGDICDDGVDEQADFRNLNILLQVEKAHLQLSNLLLNRGGHFIPISRKLKQITQCYNVFFLPLHLQFNAKFRI